MNKRHLPRNHGRVATPRQRSAAPRAQYRQGVIQVGGEAFNPEHLDPRRGKLDRQGQAVEPTADFADQRRVCIAQ